MTVFSGGLMRVQSRVVNTAFLRLYSFLEQFQRLKICEAFLLMRERQLVESYRPPMKTPNEQSARKYYLRTQKKHGAFFYDRTKRSRHATSVLMILSPDLKRILVMHHKKLDLLVFPGGHADGWINTLGTAVKETLEEVSGIPITGLDIFPKPVHCARFSAIRDDQDFELKYVAVARRDFWNVSVPPNEKDKVEMVGFVTFGELRKLRPDLEILEALDNIEYMIEQGIISPKQPRKIARGIRGFLQPAFNLSALRRRSFSLARHAALFGPFIPK